MATVTAVAPITNADYKAEIKDHNDASSLKAAQENLAGHEKNVADGTELLKTLRGMHLARVKSGHFGADAIAYAINELASELRYQRDYVTSAKRSVERLTGEKPTDEVAEF